MDAQIISLRKITSHDMIYVALLSRRQIGKDIENVHVGRLLQNKLLI